ncbi:hypothetical protein LTS08_002985 [Lithohypha guttulata]|nr:hypothetical protein LTS08_002985 [Lithohypha guttulata]
MGVHHKLSAEQPSTSEFQPTSTIVDIHTHTYPPSYIDLLASRDTVPYIHRPSDGSDPRLIILSSDDDPSKPVEKRGRPVDVSYSSWDEKLKFMRQHNISTSVVSLANPWLDFLPSHTALGTAQQINNELNTACESQNAKQDSTQRLYAFASLPLSAKPDEIVSEIQRLSSLKYIKGIILGTSGLGSGLDDPAMDPLWSALEETSTMIFLHPHYGLPDAAFGGPDVIGRSGHVLPLALGFPLETTIAVTRMYLSGVFDNFPKLMMLLAHSGGALPFLAGRIQSCVEHEREFVANGGSKQGPKRDVWDVLRTNIWLDAVIYGKAGLKGAIEAAGPNGIDRLMFGTDHPFFPPLREEVDGKWTSVQSNLAAIGGIGVSQESVQKILSGNAARVLNLEL